MDITTTTAADLGIVDTDEYTYIMTYSFPCQDLSVAGKGKGMAKGGGTRSGLLWEVERILNECDELPQVLLMENVPQVHGKKNLADFEKWCEFLEGKGYHNYWQDLNAKHYGVAQNRNRTFMVSLLSDVPYVFPEPIPLTKTMKDYLEDVVDEKFYLSRDMKKYLVSETDWSGSKTAVINHTVASTINTGEGRRRCDSSNYVCDNLPNDCDIKLNQVGQIYGTDKEPNPQAGRVYDAEGLAPTMDSCSGGNRMPKIIDKSIKVGHMGVGGQKGWVYDTDGVADCLPATQYKDPTKIVVALDEQNDCIRRETFGTLTTDGSSPKHDNRVVEITEPIVVAMRGRNPENPSDRTKGAPTQQRLEPQREGICNTLTSVQKDNLIMEPKLVGGIGDKKSNGGTQYYQQDGIYSSDGIAMAHPANIPGGSYKYLIENDNDMVLEQQPVTTKGKKIDVASTILSGYHRSNMTGFNADNAILVKQATKKGYTECVEGGVADLSYPSSATRRGRVQEGGNVCPTLTAGESDICRLESQYRIRKLTPKECWRLMGFNDEEFSRAEKVNSNTQLYKQAGNSIVVDVLVAIFRNLMEVLDMKKVEETKTIKYETDKMIDLAALMENEPDLFDELCADYPCEDAVYIYDVKRGDANEQ